eukprot:3066849-Pyramimonas_sp.AAC.1
MCLALNPETEVRAVCDGDADAVGFVFVDVQELHVDVLSVEGHILAVTWRLRACSGRRCWGRGVVA